MSTTAERRSEPRARLHLRGLLLEGNRAPVTCRIENLSAGGALIADGPTLASGAAVRIALELPKGHVVLHARVVRIDDSSPTERKYGVAFYEVPARIRDIVKEAVLRALERAMYERCVGPAARV